MNGEQKTKEVKGVPDSNSCTDPILEIRDATVTFDMERGQSKVLDGVDIDIEREEVFGVVGESGSGKSMFASALLDAVVDPGVLTGEIRYHPEDGEPQNLLELPDDELYDFRWSKISMVFQGAMNSFNPTISIKKHFKETLKAHDADVEEGFHHARELLTELYLDPDRILGSYPHELSGGMKQRTLIALSLLLKPDVLVMDEPTAALDLLMQRSILQLIENLQELYDLTVIFITHDLPLVTELSDRLAVMYAFDFVEVGPAARIVERPVHPYTRALLRAVPNVEAPLSGMKPVEGSSPDPMDIPAGCAYHPRCPIATDTCRMDDPGYYQMDDEHFAACHHWERSTESIPVFFEDEDEETSDQIQRPTTVTGSNGEDPVVSLNDVEIHFMQNTGFINRLRGKDEAVRAVDGVSLEIYENDVVALVGESGCGKTTLGMATIGVERPTSGSVEYRGYDIWEIKDGNVSEDISFQSIRRTLQIINQDPGKSLNPYHTVQSSLERPLKRWNKDLNFEDRRTRILGLLEHVGMTPPEEYAQRFPHQLSGGEKQRVALIRAMLMNPDLILADEAVSALDVSLRIEMMDLMLELQKIFDTSYLAISHDLSNARYFTGRTNGRIGVMYLGQIVEIGPTEEIVQEPRHPYTKALRWATPMLGSEQKHDELPVRKIDIPDPVDPPSGCRFHTRCPEARDVCANQMPPLYEEGEHRTACFREDENHEYWDSEPISE